MDDFIMFYGEECPHCHKMMPLVEKAEKELNININKKEVWHNSKNKKEFESYEKEITESCGGIVVPTFFNSKTKKAICGEKNYDEFILWLKEQKDDKN